MVGDNNFKGNHAIGIATSSRDKINFDRKACMYIKFVNKVLDFKRNEISMIKLLASLEVLNMLQKNTLKIKVLVGT